MINLLLASRTDCNESANNNHWGCLATDDGVIVTFIHEKTDVFNILESLVVSDYKKLWDDSAEARTQLADAVKDITASLIEDTVDSIEWSERVL